MIPCRTAKQRDLHLKTAASPSSQARGAVPRLIGESQMWGQLGRKAPIFGLRNPAE